MLQVQRLSDADARGEALWEAFVQTCPDATFFHRAGWQRILKTVFRHDTHFLYAVNDGRIEGVLPLAHVKSLIFGDALTSLPFAVYGGVAATTDEDGYYLLPLRASSWTINYQPPIGGRYLYPASQTITASGDTQLPNVALATGNLVVGQVVGMDGAPRVEQILAHQRSDDATVGGTVSDSCEGRFALAVTSGMSPSERPIDSIPERPR